MTQYKLSKDNSHTLSQSQYYFQIGPGWFITLGTN
jgi:hypothetical protein